MRTLTRSLTISGLPTCQSFYLKAIQAIPAGLYEESKTLTLLEIITFHIFAFFEMIIVSFIKKWHQRSYKWSRNKVRHID